MKFKRSGRSISFQPFRFAVSPPPQKKEFNSFLFVLEQLPFKSLSLILRTVLPKVANHFSEFLFLAAMDGEREREKERERERERERGHKGRNLAPNSKW